MTISHPQTSSLDGTSLLQGLQWRSSLLLEFPRRQDLSAGAGHGTILVQKFCTDTAPRAVAALSGWEQSPHGWVEDTGPGTHCDAVGHPTKYPTGIPKPPGEAHTSRTRADLMYIAITGKQFGAKALRCRLSCPESPWGLWAEIAISQ